MAASNRRSDPVAVALLGAGYIADFHFSALRLLPHVEVRAICDMNRGRAEQFAEAKGIPSAYADLSKMLSCEHLDVVHVLTPPNIHFETGCQVIEAGVDALIEKPLCHKVMHCQELRKRADAAGRVIGVNHNFLYFPVYEKLVTDLRSGRLGQIDQVDIVWNKELGQLRGGPFGAWMLQSPKNILFEVAPHSFVHLVHLLGQPDSICVDVHDKVELPRGLEFYRRWEIRGWKGNTSIRIRFSFIDGYPEHYIHVRGTNAIARVDFENNTYVCQEHTPYLLDVDRYANVVATARDSVLQASGTLTNFVLSKMGLSKVTGPFPHSIARTIESFYNCRGGLLDERVDPAIGEVAVALAEWVARETDLAIPQQEVSVPNLFVPPAQKSTVLVIGGTGFIGQALVRRLRQDGHGIRILTRNPSGFPQNCTASRSNLQRATSLILRQWRSRSMGSATSTTWRVATGIRGPSILSLTSSPRARLENCASNMASNGYSTRLLLQFTMLAKTRGLSRRRLSPIRACVSLHTRAQRLRMNGCYLNSTALKGCP